MGKKNKSILTVVSALVFMLLASYIFVEPEQVLAKVNFITKANYTYVSGNIYTQSGKPVKNGIVKIAVVQRFKVKGKYVTKTTYLASDRTSTNGRFSLKFVNYHKDAKYIVFVKASPRGKEIQKTVTLKQGQDIKFVVKVDNSWRPLLPNPIFVY